MLSILRKMLDKYRDKFEEGGSLEKLYPIFEATDTILFSTDEVTESGPHIRDSIDTKRVMILVVIALLPLYIFGAMNVGYQNATALFIQRSNFENFWFGLNQILPIIIVTFASGAFWELLFAVVEKHLLDISRHKNSKGERFLVLTTNFLSESPSALLIIIQIIK